MQTLPHATTALPAITPADPRALVANPAQQPAIPSFGDVFQHVDIVQTAVPMAEQEAPDTPDMEETQTDQDEGETPKPRLQATDPQETDLHGPILPKKGRETERPPEVGAANAKGLSRQNRTLHERPDAPRDMAKAAPETGETSPIQQEPQPHTPRTSAQIDISDTGLSARAEPRKIDTQVSDKHPQTSLVAPPVTSAPTENPAVVPPSERTAARAQIKPDLQPIPTSTAASNQSEEAPSLVPRLNIQPTANDPEATHGTHLVQHPTALGTQPAPAVVRAYAAEVEVAEQSPRPTQDALVRNAPKLPDTWSLTKPAQTTSFESAKQGSRAMETVTVQQQAKAQPDKVQLSRLKAPEAPEQTITISKTHRANAPQASRMFTEPPAREPAQEVPGIPRADSAVPSRELPPVSAEPSQPHLPKAERFINSGGLGTGAQGAQQIPPATGQTGPMATQLQPLGHPLQWGATPQNLVAEAKKSDQFFTEHIFMNARTESTHPTPQQHAAARTDLPPYITRQLADVVAQMPNRPVEITLSPEELGRVRLTMRVSEAGIVVNLLAERPETLDLLRRHIDQLGHDFEQLGYESIAFSFAGDDTATDSNTDTEHASNTTAFLDEEPVIETPNTDLNAAPSSGLDLRL